MDIEANKALVRSYIEMWNTGKAELADEVLTSTWVDYAHPEVSGPESVKSALHKTRAAFPDFHIAIESILSEGDLVALRGLIQRGGTFSRVMWFVRLIDGKMGEMWTGSEALR
jgi:predicted ester cyclase